MKNISFLVYLRGCDKEEVLPNEIACKEVVNLKRRNMEHLFCKEWPPPHLVALEEGAFSISWSICSKMVTCPKFIACSSDTLSMLLSPVLNSFKGHTFLCLYFVICPLISHWVGYCLISNEIYHFNGKSVSSLIKIFTGSWINLRGVAQARPTKKRRISDTGLIVSLLERNILIQQRSLFLLGDDSPKIDFQWCIVV